MNTIKSILVVLLLLGGSVEAAQDKPNILIIYTDDVGYGDVSCYEGCAYKTPNIDLLAEQGLRFVA